MPFAPDARRGSIPSRVAPHRGTAIEGHCFTREGGRRLSRLTAAQRRAVPHAPSLEDSRGWCVGAALAAPCDAYSVAHPPIGISAAVGRARFSVCRFVRALPCRLAPSSEASRRPRVLRRAHSPRLLPTHAIVRPQTGFTGAKSAGAPVFPGPSACCGPSARPAAHLCGREDTTQPAQPSWANSTLAHVVAPLPQCAKEPGLRQGKRSVRALDTAPPFEEGQQQRDDGFCTTGRAQHTISYVTFTTARARMRGTCSTDPRGTRRASGTAIRAAAARQLHEGSAFERSPSTPRCRRVSLPKPPRRICSCTSVSSGTAHRIPTPERKFKQRPHVRPARTQKHRTAILPTCFCSPAPHA